MASAGLEGRTEQRPIQALCEVTRSSLPSLDPPRRPRGLGGLLVQKRVVRSAIDSYGRIYFPATGISPLCRESTRRGIKSWRSSTPLAMQGVAHDQKS
jgi:hypothetical protein